MEKSPYQVLLIEDNLGDARLIREYLHAANDVHFTLAHTDRLTVGLQHLETTPADVILLDLSLPDSNGWDTFDRLQQHTPNTPIVILTGLQDELLARRAASNGAQEYLVKGEINGSLLVRTLTYAMERQQLLQREQKLNRALTVLSDVNQAVVRARQEQALLDEVCAILTNGGGYALAWVGLTGQDGQNGIRPAARAGAQTGYLDVMGIDKAWERGPSRRGIRTGRPFIVRDIHNNPTFAPWREAAEAYGIRGMISLPLLRDDAVLGALAIYTTEGDAFDEAEVALLTELAGDLAFGIDTLRKHNALRQSEEMFATAFYNSTMAMAITDVQSSRIIDVNDSTLTLFGYERSEVIGNTAKKLDVWVDPDVRQKILDQLLQGTGVRDLELKGRTKNGDTRHVLGSFDRIDIDDAPCILTVMHDVTARKEAEEAQRQAQQLAQATIDALTAHIVVLDEEGNIIAVNQSWQDFAQANDGDPQRTGAGVNYLAVCDAVVGPEADEAQQFANDIRAVIARTRDRVSFEYQCHAPHELRWFIARVSPLMAGDSGRRVVIAHENITSRKLAENALRDSERHYRLLFDSNPLPMWVYDLESLAFLAVNDAALSKYGYSRDAFLQMKLHEIQRPSETAVSGEQQHRLKDGRIVDVEISSDTLNYDGRHAALVTAFDVTERKRAAEERIAQAQRTQQILDTMSEGVVLLDSDRCILNMNPKAAELLPALTTAKMEETLTEIGGKPIDSFLTDLHAEATWHEVEVSAEKRLFALTAQPIEIDKTVSGWVLVLREVTEERKRQQHLEMQQRLATVGQMAAGIAHDFNNIMAVISLYSDLLTRNPNHERRADYLQTINAQSKHAAKLISQILDFSRRSVMTRSKLDLRPFVKELVKLLQRTLSETIEITFAESAGQYFVEADPTHLQQALMNLAVNARDAMPDGGKLKLRLTHLSLPAEQPTPVPDMASGEWIRLSLTDSGTGIEADIIPHLFEPFFTTKVPGQGTGLGLAQVYGIVKQLDGEITVASDVGKGTTFTIYLPALSSPTEVVTDDEKTRLRTGSGQTILLVEDNDTTRNAIAEILDSLNYKVLTTDNGVSAIQRFAAHSGEIALVVTDMVMPKMSGSELYTQLKAIDQNVKVVIITGYPLEENGQKLLSQGIVAWVQKPFSVERLAEAIHRALKSPG